MSRKTKRECTIIMSILLVLMIVNVVVHSYKTKEFNKQRFSMDNGMVNEDCAFSLRPQNNKDISWTRTATIDGQKVDLYACSYEGTFINYSKTEVSEWTLRIVAESDCYVNSAWCGLVEIHQFVDDVEKVQMLDLRNINRDEVELNFYEDGDIFLFPLSKGDYLIYYPDIKAREMPVYAAGKEPEDVGMGLIIYWNQDSVLVTPNYLVDYQFNRDFFQGSEATLLMVGWIVWALAFVILLVANITTHSMRKKALAALEKKDIERKAVEKMLDEMIRTLANTIDAKDEYTHGHSERVAQYSLMLAQKQEMSSDECKQVFYAGLVHDVGKIAVPKEIINKPARLTDDEFEIIKSHPGRGETILKQIEDMPYLAIGAKYHHEKYDGTGYPDQVKGDKIPLLARIIAVADAYDAMTSRRSYRDTLDQRIVKQEIWKGIGSQFDPLIAKHMIELIDADIEYDMREKVDEKYVLIDEIKKNEYWENYNHMVLKVEDKVLSDTHTKYFGQFVDKVDHWFSPIKLSIVESKESLIKFKAKSHEGADFIWNTPTVILYTSDGGEPAGNNYEDIAVFMSAGYSWRAGAALAEHLTLTRREKFVDWKNWTSSNRAGLEYTVKVHRDNNHIYLTIENDLLVVAGVVDLPDSYSKEVYICATGERCDITDVHVM